MARALSSFAEPTNLKPTHRAVFSPPSWARIIGAIAERLNLPLERVFMNLDKYGNTSAATIPVALDEANKAGRLNKGDVVLLVAFGGGFTWASSVVRW